MSYEAVLSHSDLSLLLLSQNPLQDKMAFGSLGGRFGVLGGGILFLSPGAMTLSPRFWRLCWTSGQQSVAGGLRVCLLPTENVSHFVPGKCPLALPDDRPSNPAKSSSSLLPKQQPGLSRGIISSHFT